MNVCTNIINNLLPYYVNTRYTSQHALNMIKNSTKMNKKRKTLNFLFIYTGIFKDAQGVLK